MCGICGAIWASPKKAVDLASLDRATDAMRRRGPDARGVAREPIEPGVSVEEKGVALGHRRLAIIDLSDAGRQPFVNDDRSIWLTFNGEIYNYIEIRNELRQRGRLFRTETDVEVLLRAYEEFGIDCLPKLNGMFAFAIWDARKKRLVVARDRIGKKPLFYRVEPERLLFASELKALTLFPDVPRDLDLTALRQYLTYQYVPYPRTIYRGIAKLPPASFLIWQDGKDLTIDRYWRAEDVANFDERRKYAPGDVERALKNGALGAARFGSENGWFSQNGGNREGKSAKRTADYIEENDFTDRSFEETTRELRRRLEDATRLRMRSDAPFGAFLSGGVDSTVVVGLMKQFSEKKIRTFSIGFAQKEYDETPFARRTAAFFGTEHTEFFVEPDAETILRPLVREYGEPFADSSAIPTWYLCETTRREATVALGGDGGDELFAGYDRYKAVWASLLINKAPRSLRRFLAGPLRRAIPNSVRQRSPLRRARRFLETVGMDALEQYLQWIAIFNRERLYSLLSKEYWEACAEEKEFDGVASGSGIGGAGVFGKDGKIGDLGGVGEMGRDGGRPNADELDCVDFLAGAFEKFRRRDLTTAISFVDLLTYLPGDLTTKVDVASMRSSLEVRAPALDPNVVELALQIPLKYKIWGRKGKYVLREACRDLLPAEIDARPKTGFGVPLDAWFRGPLNKTLKDALLSGSPNASPFFEKKFVERLIKEHENREFDHAARLWSLLVFRTWEEEVKNR